MPPGKRHEAEQQEFQHHLLCWLRIHKHLCASSSPTFPARRLPAVHTHKNKRTSSVFKTKLHPNLKPNQNAPFYGYTLPTTPPRTPPRTSPCPSPDHTAPAASPARRRRLTGPPPSISATAPVAAAGSGQTRSTEPPRRTVFSSLRSRQSIVQPYSSDADALC